MTKTDSVKPTKTKLSDQLRIENKNISKRSPIFIITETGVNHNGDLRLAKQLINIAKECGADTVKFQTINTEKLVTVNTPKAIDKKKKSR